MTETGKFNRLKVTRKLDAGAYLDGEELGEIFLPRSYMPEDCRTGDIIDVFIFFDSEDHLIATTQRPYAVVGDFAFLKVVAVNPVGAFLDWGLPKDLLAPFREQKQRMEEGKSYIVFIYLDDRSRRIVASSKLDKFLDKQPVEFQEGQSVELLIYDRTDLGYKSIINNSRRGILYKNEVFQPLKNGQRITGFIKKVRDDGKIDLCLQKPGYENIDDVSQKILDKLRAQGGFIPATDKSSPEIIYGLFGVSKKTYKKATGALYKKRLITIEDNGISLIKK
ncbi:MAG: GntR family transcriptional regulator [Nitrospiraceae bacterium]|nr:MAG: GntR family transcriptional regulator [Nitrospiraceae bacterium]